MYNRYIPQPDGSFRRTKLPDRSRPVPPKPAPEDCPPPPPPPEPCAVPETPPASCPPPKQKPCTAPIKPPKPCPPKPEPRPCAAAQQSSIGGFFRQLLPKGLDTGDLLIILLLLLMAGDGAEDQNTALLTLVLYLFM